MKKNVVKKMIQSDVNLQIVPDPPSTIDGVVIGLLSGFKDRNQPLVTFGENPFPNPLLARTAIPLNLLDVGKDVVLQFEKGQPNKPIIIGVLQKQERSLDDDPNNATPLVEIDGEKIIFNANSEIVLRCGEASITLTRAGKVLIKGDYVVSRSTGVNRIKGGSVQIN